MKTSFFFLCLFVGNIVLAAVGDSIVVNVGKRSAITFYGKTAEDLRQIERLDLNKVFQNAHRQYERMSQDSLQIRVVDEQNRQQYLFGLPTPQTPTESIKNLTRWQRYKRNTFVNVYVGFNPRIYESSYANTKYDATFSNNFSVVEFFGDGFPKGIIYTTDDLNLNTRSVVQLGFDHENKLSDRKKSRLAFRYGVGISFTSLMLESQNASYYPALRDKTFEEIQELTQKLYDSGYGSTYGYYDIRGISAYFQAISKFYLKNKNNEETWHFGLGARLNMNGFTPPSYDFNTPVINGSSIGHNRGNEEIIVNTPMYHIQPVYYSYTYSFIVELGYKRWSLWTNYEPRFMKLSQHNKTASGGIILGVHEKYMNNFTLGIKYGR